MSRLDLCLPAVRSLTLVRVWSSVVAMLDKNTSVKGSVFIGFVSLESVFA